MTKSVASETDLPEGLDVVPMEPKTEVGGRDMQGADGKTRTDRPGEILGTPAHNDEEGRAAESREREAKRADYITAEVDRANREELPKLGGPVDDGWEPGDATATRSTSTRTTDAARPATTDKK